ncbi:hypothetical protein [Streptomyces sp. AM6-12]|uniref:hypothetical protein n=1 Tax=Streptomyces sp. AM6-12 TaxID=3345149 RepID=UPI00379466B4
MGAETQEVGGRHGARPRPEQRGPDHQPGATHLEGQHSVHRASAAGPAGPAGLSIDVVGEDVECGEPKSAMSSCWADATSLGGVEGHAGILAPVP